MKQTKTKKVKIIEKRKGCLAYDCDKVYYVQLKEGAIASDHTHKHQETIFLMKGEAELILEEEIIHIKAPAKITIPPKAYHKITAITDWIGLEIK